MSILRVLLILCALTCVDATGAEREVRIGVIDTFNPHFSSETLEPTLAFMRAKLPQYDFVTDTIHTAKPVESMKDRKVDFFIATAGIFSELQQTIGAKHIATRRRTQAGNPAESVASVFIVRAERRDLKTFADLKGKKVVASQSNSFDGWQIAMGRLADEGYDWRKFFSERRFTHFQIPDVVLDVLSGNADVGIIGACTLENLESEGWIEKDALRVVGDKSDGTFPCRRSTDLYPDIVVGALEEARADVVRDVTVALLTMPPESNYDWSVASNFKAVNDLFRKLEIGQYAYLHDRSWSGLWNRHKEKFFIFLLALAILAAHELRLNFLVRKRTKELRVALEEKERADMDARESRERLSRLERSGAISQLSSMIAHELKQPIGSILNYVSGLQDYWRKTGLHDELSSMALDRTREEAERICGIVDRVRAYAKHKNQPLCRVNLSEAAERAIYTFSRNWNENVVLSKCLAKDVYVLGHSLELELCVLNLLKNAAYAVRSQEKPLVTIRIELQNGKAVLEVSDNGPKLDDKAFGRLREISDSVKADGLGLGLAIVRDIVDRHSAELAFHRGAECGLTVRLVMDAAGGTDSTRVEDSVRKHDGNYP